MSRSGVSGMAAIEVPSAWQTPLITAGAGPSIGSSPKPLAPRGPYCEGCSSKCTRMGGRSPLAVEVVRFGWGTYLAPLSALGCDPIRRMQGAEPYLTDEGNYIVDCHFTHIDDPVRMECELNLIPGVIENGIFNGLASLVYVASESGVRELRPEQKCIR